MAHLRICTSDQRVKVEHHTFVVVGLPNWQNSGGGENFETSSSFFALSKISSRPKLSLSPTRPLRERQYWTRGGNFLKFPVLVVKSFHHIGQLSPRQLWHNCTTHNQQLMIYVICQITNDDQLPEQLRACCWRWWRGAGLGTPANSRTGWPGSCKQDVMIQFVEHENLF